MIPMGITKVRYLGNFTLVRSKPWLKTTQRVNQVHSQGHGNVWISYQAVRALRHSVFLIQHEKRLISIICHEEQEGRLCCKSLEQTQISPLTEQAIFFSQMRKFFLPVLYSYMQIHTEHHDTMKTQWIKTTEDFFKKIYFSLYLLGCM